MELDSGVSVLGQERVLSFWKNATFINKCQLRFFWQLRKFLRFVSLIWEMQMQTPVLCFFYFDQSLQMQFNALWTGKYSPQLVLTKCSKIVKVLESTCTSGFQLCGMSITLTSFLLLFVAIQLVSDPGTKFGTITHFPQWCIPKVISFPCSSTTLTLVTFFSPPIFQWNTCLDLSLVIINRAMLKCDW